MFDEHEDAPEVTSSGEDNLLQDGANAEAPPQLAPTAAPDTASAPETVAEGGAVTEAEAVAEAEPAPAEPLWRSEIDPDIEIPYLLPVLPLKDTVVYPYAVMPLGVGKERSIRLIEEAMKGERLVTLVAQKDANIEEAGPDDCFSVGVVARIARMLRVPDGTMSIIVQGLDRVQIEEFTDSLPYLKARIRFTPETIETGVEIEAQARAASELFQRLVNLVQDMPDQLAMAALNQEDARQAAYLIASNARFDLEARQELLELDSTQAKLERECALLTREVEVLELGRKIQSDAQEEMGKAQREYILREQLKAIQKELGEESDEAATISEFRKQIEAANLPEEAKKEALRELSRLERVPSAMPEYSVIRTYLEVLLSLPWSVSTGQRIDVAKARTTLDEDHYDLEKIKDRILEYLAVRQLREDRQAEADERAAKETAAQVSSQSGSKYSSSPTQPKPSDEKAKRHINREPILCFVGPPGVGKTSLGQSIARALGREFVRLSLGGVHDEAEIRGHRRTYIGALPGRILQSLRRAKANDPVFMLDEVDKLSSDWRGDPSSAMLEVLDPEQNYSFRDNYLDLAFDLSRVMFIATANTLDTIPAPLRDRMEILELAGYTEDEKLHIARKYLLPKQVKANGLKDEEINLPDATLQAIIREYTREAGVRNLERQIGSVCRKVARMVAEGQTPPGAVTPEMLRDFLGRQRFFSESAERIDRPGVATGLAWTAAGGDIMFIEAAMIPSREENLKLTGQLGDVMKESAQAALTYVRSNAQALGIDARVFHGKSLHIHVPEGSIPKDGPSAGITMTTAIASLALGRKVRSDVAMTGEISLRGKVLPIGGLKEKALAAHRAGITTVILPKRNEFDLEELPKELRAQMTFIPVDDAREALAIAVEGGLPVRPGTALPRPDDLSGPALTRD
ncbi:MAG TPA: endopeptidase La [Ktedonobacterales bacterium]